MKMSGNTQAERDWSPRRMMVAAAIVVMGLVVAAGLAVALALLAQAPGAAGPHDGSSDAGSAQNGASPNQTQAAQPDASTTPSQTAPATQQAGGVLAQAESQISKSVTTNKRRLAAQQAKDAFTLSAADLRAIPASDNGPARFSLAATGIEDELASSRERAVRNAIAAIEQDGACGFVFLDADTGEGLAYNADETVYIASASKAVLAYYALQNGASEQPYERDSIESTILYSDNGSFEAFGYNYFDSDYIDWLAEHDTEWELSTYDLYVPMSARGLAMAWADILRYVDSGSEDATWFADLLADTSVSFIRDAIGDDGVQVLNKAGWIVDWDVNSVTDAAIVRDDGRTYLMVIATDQPDSPDAEAAVSTLADALYDLRDALE